MLLNFEHPRRRGRRDAAAEEVGEATRSSPSAERDVLGVACSSCCSGSLMKFVLLPPILKSLMRERDDKIRADLDGGRAGRATRSTQARAEYEAALAGGPGRGATGIIEDARAEAEAHRAQLGRGRGRGRRAARGGRAGRGRRGQGAGAARRSAASVAEHRGRRGVGGRREARRPPGADAGRRGYVNRAGIAELTGRSPTMRERPSCSTARDGPHEAHTRTASSRRHQRGHLGLVAFLIVFGLLLWKGLPGDQEGHGQAAPSGSPRSSTTPRPAAADGRGRARPASRPAIANADERGAAHPRRGRADRPRREGASSWPGPTTDAADVRQRAAATSRPRRRRPSPTCRPRSVASPSAPPRRSWPTASTPPPQRRSHRAATSTRWGPAA